MSPVIHLIYTVLVSSNPDVAVLSQGNAVYTVFPYEVLFAQPVPHVCEVIYRFGLHIDTFLEHTKPEVALFVLDDTVYFRLGQVDLTTEVWVVL